MTTTYAYLIHEPAWGSQQWLDETGSPRPELGEDPDMAKHGAFERAVEEFGARVVGGAALHDPPLGGLTTPGPAGSEVAQAVHTDSPYADSSELITGFYLVEVDDPETAKTIAAMVPTGGTVEWRQVFPMG